jgi:hypothetical protein
MMGLIFVLENLRPQGFDRRIDTGMNMNITGWYSSLIVLVLLAGPLIVRGIRTPPKATAATCQPGADSIVISYDPGTSIQLIRQRDFALDWMPVFHQGFFKLNAHGLPDNYLAEWLGTINSLTTLFYTLDIRTNKAVLVIIPTSQLAKPGSFMELCGEWTKDPLLTPYNIFIADNAKAITN